MSPLHNWWLLIYAYKDFFLFYFIFFLKIIIVDPHAPVASWRCSEICLWQLRWLIPIKFCPTYNRENGPSSINMISKKIAIDFNKFVCSLIIYIYIKFHIIYKRKNKVVEGSIKVMLPFIGIILHILKNKNSKFNSAVMIRLNNK